MNTIEEQITEAVMAMTAAFHAADLEAIMASYAPEATIVFEPGQPVRDRKEQEELFRQAFAIKPHFTYSGHEVYVNGDVGMHLAPWRMTGTAPDGTPIEQAGLSVAVLNRDASGTWKIVLDDPHGEHLLGNS